MKYAAIAVIAALLLLFGCTGQDAQTTGIGSVATIGSDAQIAVGFINPVVTLLNMSKYAIYGTNATFSGTVAASNFAGNMSGTTANFTNVTAGNFIGGNYSGDRAAFTNNVSASAFNGDINGTTGDFSGNVTAQNFNGNLSGHVNASNVDNPYWLNLTDQRYNESARVDAVNSTAEGVKADYANKSANENISGSYTFLNNITVLGQMTSINVTTQNVNGSQLPVADNLFDLGNSTSRWRNITIAGNASVAGRDVVSYLDTLNGTKQDAATLGTAIGNSTIARTTLANNFTNTNNYMVNATYYAWINPYNSSTYCQWLNASCQICVTGTVSETRC